MINPQSKFRKKNKAVADSDAARNIQKRFNEIQYDYLQALQEAQIEAENVHAEAHLIYMQAVQDAQMKAQKASMEAHHNYLQELNAAGPQEAPENLQVEAYRKYMQALNQLQLEAQKLCMDAYDNYVQALGDIRNNVQEHIEKAYRDYALALKEWWTQVNMDDVDAISLAAIGQTISAAAFHTIGTLEHQGFDMIR